jgi:AcrR family transcriptional regulator
MREIKPEQKIASAALRLAATRGWTSLTLSQIAKAAKMPLAKAQKLFSDKDQILPAIVAYVDDETAAAIGKPLTRSTPRDRLFEVMMARFDVLQENRKGILAIAKAVRQNPQLARLLLPAYMQTIKKLLLLAHIPTTKAQQPLVIAGLLTVQAATLCRWQSDNTADLAKTMAALDRSLGLAEKIAETVLRPI